MFSSKELKDSVLKNVVGSIDENAYRVYGTGGNVRHAGQFSDNNPYLSQLRAATNNKDKDALYERAVEWEADYANRQIQLEENRAILEEQREYDSPLAQIQRQREAGINPDIAGAGGSSAGGSGSAQLSNPAMADQTAQSKFSNAYDNTAEVFNGINTATNALSSFANFGGTLVSAIDTLSTLPSRVSLGDTQAYVADKTKDVAVEQAGANLSGTKLANAGKLLSNASDTLNLFGSMSQFLTADSTEEDINNAFDYMQIPQEQRAGLQSGFQKYLSSPKAIAAYQESVKQQNDLVAYNTEFTPLVLSNLNNLNKKMMISEKQFSIKKNDFERNLLDLSELYNIPEKQTSLLSTEIGTQQTALQEMQMRLQDSMDSMVESFNFMDESKQKLQAEKDAILNRANDLHRPLTSIEKAQIKTLTLQISQIDTKKASQVEDVADIVLRAEANGAFLEQNTRADGNIRRGTGKRNRQNQALNVIFGRYYDGTMSNEQLGKEVMNYISSGLDIAGKTTSVVNDVISIAGKAKK